MTLAFDQRLISLEETPAGYRRKLRVYGLLRNLSRQIVFEFDDDIEAVFSAERLPEALALPGSYQRKLGIPPGKYRFDLVLQDVVAGKMGTLVLAIDPPAVPADSVATSSIILTRTPRGRASLLQGH